MDAPGYLPMVRRVKVPGIMGGRERWPGAAAGAGPKSAVAVKMWPVAGAKGMGGGPRLVLTFCSTANAVGEDSLMMVRVPSPWVLKTSCVAGLKRAPSQPTPMGRVE